MKSKLLRTGAAWVLAPALIGAGSAAAQVSEGRKAPLSADSGSMVGEVIVTARRRAEDIVKTPVAVTAVSGAQLKAANVTSLNEIDRLAPSLRVSPIVGRLDQVTFSIRGMNETSGLITADPAVGVYFADAIQTRSQGVGRALFDIASVQVLNGPQGTLFGRNLTGGAILIEPNAPVLDKWEGYAQGTYGNYDRREFQGAVNVPLGDMFALRLGANISGRDGYMFNVVTNTNIRSNYSNSYRASLLFQPTNDFHDTLVFDGFDGHGLGGGFTPVAVNPNLALPVPFNAALVKGELAALQAQQARTVYQVAETQNFPYSDSNYGITNTSVFATGALTFKNIFSWRDVKSADVQGSGLPKLLGFDILRVLNADTHVQQTTDELQVLGNALDRKIEYQAGVYYFREFGHSLGGVSTFSSPYSQAINVATNESESVYAQADFHFTHQLTLTTGGRYTWDTRKLFINAIGASGVTTLAPTSLDKHFSEPTWTVSLNYTPDDASLIYITNRRGYRSGGFNGGATTLAQLTTIQPEILTDYEFGAKRRGQVGQVGYQATLAIFHSDYDNLQRNLVKFIAGVPNRVLTNAGSAAVNGGEFAATVVPIHFLYLSGFVGYTDAKYGKSSPFFGIPFSQTPKWTYNLSGRLSLPSPEGDGHLSLTTSYSHTSSILITDAAVPPGSAYVAPGYGLLSARLDYEHIAGTGAHAALFATNLLDQDYVLAGTPFYTNLGFTSYVYGEPRMFGVEIGYSF
jgi:iron complex outermembrane receptor protein